METAYDHVCKFPAAETRAAYLPLVSAAFADAKRIDRAEETLRAAIQEFPKVEGEELRSRGYAAVAKAQAHLHR